MIKDYIKIARFDHWIKQLFIVPGFFMAVIMVKNAFSFVSLKNIIIALFGTSFIASANYIINEWLDAEFDKFHPVKKNRSFVSAKLNYTCVVVEYLIFAIFGLLVMYFVNKYVFIISLALLMMGILYNVRPFRTKEIVYVDVLTESINNALRFLIGWFAIISKFYPPISIVFGYWMAGAFLMAIKRYAEYRMIGNKDKAALYRKSFKYYTEKSLLIYSFFFALMSTFFLGVFLVKYRVELIIFIPFMIGLYCYYFYISFKQDSAVQKPEKLYKEKFLMFYVAFLIILFIILMVVDIDFLNIFVSNNLIPIK